MWALRDEEVQLCPYCFEPAELWVDPQSEGEMVEDCAVCCRPWRVVVTRDETGEARFYIERAQ